MLYITSVTTSYLFTDYKKHLCDPYTLGCVRKWHPATAFACEGLVWPSRYLQHKRGENEDELIRTRGWKKWGWRARRIPRSSSQIDMTTATAAAAAATAPPPHQSSLRAAYAEFVRIFAMVSGTKKMNNQRESAWKTKHERHSGFNSWDGFINSINYSYYHFFLLTCSFHRIFKDTQGNVKS